MLAVSAELEEVKTIREWSEAKTLTETQSLFFKRFSTITASITECMKQGDFKWTPAAHSAFLDIKKKLTKTYVLRHPDLYEVFEVACDAYGVGRRCSKPKWSPFCILY